MCNLKLRTPFFLPVVIHNLSYDLSLMLKNYDEDKFSFNINKKEGMHFYSATVGKLKLLDSCKNAQGQSFKYTVGVHHI